MELDRFTKAIVGSLLAGLTALSVALINGSDITALEWVSIATAVVTSLGFIWAVPNTINPQDVSETTLLQAASLKNLELAPKGSTVKAGEYDILPTAITKNYPNG